MLHRLRTRIWERARVIEVLAAAGKAQHEVVYLTLQVLSTHGDEVLGAAVWSLADYAVRFENARGHDTSNASMGVFNLDREQIPPEQLMADGGPEAVGGIGGTRFFVAALRGDEDLALAIWQGVVGHEDRAAVDVARREFVGVVVELSLKILHPQLVSPLDEL
jgi:hypothetical protein